MVSFNCYLTFYCIIFGRLEINASSTFITTSLLRCSNNIKPLIFNVMITVHQASFCLMVSFIYQLIFTHYEYISAYEETPSIVLLLFNNT